MGDQRNCLTCSNEEIFLWLSGGLDDSGSQAISKHLSECGCCKQRILFEAELVCDLAQLAKPADPPRGVKGRLMARIVGSQHQSSEERTWRTMFRRRRQKSLSFLSAGIALAFGLGFLVSASLGPSWNNPRPDSEKTTLELALRDARIQALEAENQLLSCWASETEESLVNASWPVINHDGSSVGSIVCQTEGLNCFLEATGLQRLGPARVYSLWLENNEGRLVHLGIFDADTSGDAAFFTYADRELENARNLVVTIEPWDIGRSRPQGPIVFRSDPRF